MRYSGARPRTFASGTCAACGYGRLRKPSSCHRRWSRRGGRLHGRTRKVRHGDLGLDFLVRARSSAFASAPPKSPSSRKIVRGWRAVASIAPRKALESQAPLGPSSINFSRNRPASRRSLPLKSSLNHGEDHEFSHYSRATESLLLPAIVWAGRRRAQEIFTYSPSLGRIVVFANISCACRPQLSSLFTSGPSTTSIALRVSQSGRAVEAAHSRM